MNFTLSSLKYTLEYYTHEYIKRQGEKQENSYYDDYININSDYADAHYQIGIIYAKLGEVGKALERFKVLKNLDQNLADRLFETIYP